MVPFRGWEYYFSDPEWARRKMAGEGIGALSAESDTRQKQGFVDAAVSGETIREGAKSGIWVSVSSFCSPDNPLGDITREATGRNENEKVNTKPVDVAS